MRPATVSARTAALTTARRELAMTVAELWLAYIGIGGNRPFAALQGWLATGTHIPDRDYDFLAQALNDRFADQGANHPVAYSDHVGPVGDADAEAP